MEDNKVHDSKLEKVSGGLETVFHGTTSVCPVCGHTNLKLVSGDEYVDKYYCEHCGMTSTHTKKEKPVEPPVHPSLQCTQCGSIGRFKLVKKEGGLDTVQCTVCKLQMTVPAE